MTLCAIFSYGVCFIKEEVHLNLLSFYGYTKYVDFIQGQKVEGTRLPCSMWKQNWHGEVKCDMHIFSEVSWYVGLHFLSRSVYTFPVIVSLFLTPVYTSKQNNMLQVLLHYCSDMTVSNTLQKISFRYHIINLHIQPMFDTVIRELLKMKYLRFKPNV